MELKPNHELFLKEIEERDIQYLIHFTPTINLLSMYEQKNIISRAVLESLDADQFDIFDYVEFTDEIRFDDKSYINLSIQHPNSYLFNRFRNKTSEDMYITWCVLKINPKYIYLKDTLFSVTNAANSHNRRNVRVTGDIEKFRMLFSPSIQVVTSYNSRTVTRGSLPSKYPTDEQAEVLVRDNISVSDILQVCFKDENDLASGKAALSGYDTSNFIVDASIFSQNRN
ncbi:DarT ssDNA thymidine ADP-ribosyltransferase family protein [Carboxylicivirga taeanensis]|uniref:DarT ssDNA thymidine ADP-ribosyltransferase family protein n=1 Tax=Carboxylicivirga taeanensis TaxID=1416875 RepID=UPI003F6DC76B